MILGNLQASEKRERLRNAIRAPEIVRAPGAFSPLIAIELENQGFEAVYASGAVISADLGLPDIGLTTLGEVVDRAEQIARVTDLPLILDCDTGFGEAMNAARTMRYAEDRGISCLQIEDQVSPKRCGHLDGKTLVSKEDMVRRLRAACDARRDPNTVIVARTDAFATEGMPGTIERARAYIAAGADVIFPEALATREDWRQAVAGIAAPLLANMTEFGKSELLSADELQEFGVSIVIYPVTLLRVAMHAAIECIVNLRHTGTQVELLDRMQSRQELYQLLRYEDYNRFDKSIYNFSLHKGVSEKSKAPG